MVALRNYESDKINNSVNESFMKEDMAGHADEFV